MKGESVGLKWGIQAFKLSMMVWVCLDSTFEFLRGECGYVVCDVLTSKVTGYKKL